MASRKRPPRTRSIRLTLASLFIIPLVTLVGLWGFAASVTLKDTIAKHSYDTQNTDTGGPGQALLVQLVQERLESFVWLGSGHRSSHTPVEFQREHTDAAVIAFRNGVAAAEGVMTPATKQSLAALLVQIRGLPGIRDAIDFGAMNASQAFQAYNGVVDAQFQFFDSQATINDVSLYREAEATIASGRALEMVGREAALAGEALAAHGRMGEVDHNLFVQTVATQRFLENEALSQLSGRLVAPYKLLFASPTYTSFKTMEDQIVASPPTGPLPVNPIAWQSGVQSFLTAFNQTVGIGRQAVTRGLRQAGSGIQLRLILAGGAGLLAVIISALLLLRFGRRLSRELVGLHEAARKLADERLPWVVSRLRRGEDIDIPTEAPPLYPGKTTEIAKVAQAFSTVQRTAVEAAVGQAQLRKGVNQVFLNLARRNQSLLHRQLDMLDSLERSTADPEVLEDFFRLDHLTTRMRRNAEGLIILSGEVPGRGWRSPVRVLDVLRAAIAEVEDYVRVDVVNESREAIVGTAVADTIHLLAELIENATAFSPPNTRVTVSADRVGSGFAVEVEDRGLGISPGELADINQRLASPPEFDLADSDRLGLFVVGQLAARHQIKVSLVESPFGGTTAVVLMPHTIVVPESDLDSVDGNGHGGHGNGHGGHGNGHGGHGGHGGAQAGLRADEGLAAQATAGIMPWEHGPATRGVNGGPSPLAAAEPAGPQPVIAVAPAPGQPDAPPPVAPWPDAPPPGALQSDTLQSDTLPPDVLPPDVLPPDPWRPDPPETWRPDPPDTWRPDPPDTWRPDPPDTWRPDPPETWRPDPPDTWRPDPPDTWQPDPPDTWPQSPETPAPWLETPEAATPWVETQETPASWLATQVPETPDGMSNGSAARGPGGTGAGAAPARAAGGAAHTAAGPTPAAAGTSGTYMGLPRRIRQASLAPQLRTVPAPDPGAAAAQADPPGQRSPEDARAMMTSLQQGWQRGRAGAAAPGEDATTDVEGGDV